VRLISPLPTMMIPPQSPGRRDPTGRCEVKTMGAAAVPCASIFAPRRIQSELPGASVSPTIRVPAWMVRVAPFCTFT